MFYGKKKEILTFIEYLLLALFFILFTTHLISDTQGPWTLVCLILDPELLPNSYQKRIALFFLRLFFGVVCDSSEKKNPIGFLVNGIRNACEPCSALELLVLFSIQNGYTEMSLVCKTGFTIPRESLHWVLDEFLLVTFPDSSSLEIHFQPIRTVLMHLLNWILHL